MMSASRDLFGWENSRSAGRAKPKEPLFSMLCEGPNESVQWLLESLQENSDDHALKEIFPEVGLQRWQYIEQIRLAMEFRQRWSER